MNAARNTFFLAVLLVATQVGADPVGPSESLGPRIMHLPVLERHAEQGILRPVPLSVELPGDLVMNARRVLVHYRLWGEPDWTTLQLRRNGARYEGAIPCLQVSTVTGDLRYYIRVHDPEGRVIASGASRARPYIVTIKHDTTLGAEATKVVKCPDPADCPRGLPGCPSEEVEIACQSDKDCEGGMVCSWRGTCERAVRRTNWLSLSVEQDVGVMSKSGACRVSAQENEGYACYRADGIQYTGHPVYTNEPLGVGRGPTRVVIGFERLVYYDTSLGVRLGWAFMGSGPTPRAATAFMPLSISLRATHWFGDDLFVRSGFRPFAFVTAGYAMVDVKTNGHVREDPTAFSMQGNNDLEQTLTVWKRAGDGFVGVGGGLAFAWTPGTSVFLEVPVLETFPFGVFVIAPTGGVQVAF